MLLEAAIIEILALLVVTLFICYGRKQLDKTTRKKKRKPTIKPHFFIDANDPRAHSMNQILTEKAFPRKKNRAPSKPRKESLAPSKPRKESLAQSKPRKESPAPSKPRKKVQVPSKPWGEGWMPSKDVASFPAEIDKDLGSKVMEAKTARAKAEDEAAKGPTYNLSAGNEDSKNPSECRINKTQTVTLE